MILSKSKIYEIKLITPDFSDKNFQYYFRKDYSHCDWALCGACREDYRKLVDYILPKWRFNPNFPFASSAGACRINIMQYFIALGASDWSYALGNTYFEDNIQVKKYLRKHQQKQIDSFYVKKRYYRISRRKSE